MDDLTVAKTIFAQIKGNRLSVMTGAKNFVGGEDFLSFRFPRSKGVNYCKITLDYGQDLYDIEYGYIASSKYTVKQTFTGYYFDMILPNFEEVTGLYTSL